MKPIITASVLVLGLMFSSVGHAYDKKDEDMIRTSLEMMKEHAKHNSVEAVMNVMPPKLFDVFAEVSGISVEEIKDDIGKEVAHEVGQHRDSEVGYDMSRAKIYRSPQERDYLIIPTSTRVYDVVIEGHILAVKDDGKWYFVNIADGESIGMIKKAYPDLTELNPDDF